MQKNVLEYLENTALKTPDHTAYQDDNGHITISEVLIKSKKLGTVIAENTKTGSPVAVIAGKTILTPVIYLGIVYAGCYYLPISNEMPEARIKMILDFINPALIITDNDNEYTYPVIRYKGTEETEINEKELANRREKQQDSDPLCVIFTSGSSGTPKGVVLSHKNIINYITVFANTFDIRQDDILGNQAPLDYIAAIRDIYLPLYTGAKTVLIQKALFSMPVKLFDYVNSNNITVICWVASALSFCSELGVFKEVSLKTIKKVFFTGSVLPCKHLRVWQENIPNAMFVNHYGPTEITASCSYFIVDHKVEDNEVLPIGKPFSNYDIFLINEKGTEIPQGEIGEICVRGAGVALGYYNNKEQTDTVFIQNPLNSVCSDIIYKTGDLGSIDKDGLMYYHGRKDYQIKHMGHRVELGEIENNAMSIKEVKHCCCLYQEEKELIWLFYIGDIEHKEIAIYLRKLLPGYMIPRRIEKLEKLPVLENGKVDIKTLKEITEKEKYG